TPCARSPPSCPIGCISTAASTPKPTTTRCPTPTGIPTKCSTKPCARRDPAPKGSSRRSAPAAFPEVSWSSVSRTTRHGRRVVVKRTTYDAGLEADRLQAVANAGALVADVIEADSERLVIEEVSGPERWEELGRSLAHCHSCSADAFGYTIDNGLGPLPQSNTWDQSWSNFYAEQRLGPHLDVLPTDLADRIRSAI